MSVFLSTSWSLLVLIDTPAMLGLAASLGLLAGYVFYAPNSRNPARVSGVLFFVPVMLVQFGFAFLRALSGHVTLALAIGPYFWLPVWAVMALGITLGIGIWRRHHGVTL